jgi:rubrerythrin
MRIKKIIIGMMTGVLLMGMLGCSTGSDSQETKYPETRKNLMEAVAGETQANANYQAFADVAEQEGHKELAVIFRAIGDAELKHANDQFDIAAKLASVTKPTPSAPATGSTRENLQAAINGETEEYTKMYPGFTAMAQTEGMQDARRIFNYAMQAEQGHAVIYADLLANFDQFDSEKYGKLYRCITCGKIFLSERPQVCTVCADGGDTMVEYNVQ